jgi:hypothetical protein
MVSGASRREQRDVKGLFSQVNAENMHVFPPNSVWNVFLAQPCPCLLHSRSRILHGLMEHVSDVCQQTNLSYGVTHRGLSRFFGTQHISTARKIPVTHRTWSFVVPIVKNGRPFKQGIEIGTKQAAR